MASTARCSSTQRGEERVVRDRARQHAPTFVKNRERLVDRFHVMIRTDIAIGVWRRASTKLRCSPALKGKQRRWHGGRRLEKTFNQPLLQGEEEVSVADGSAPVPGNWYRVRRRSSVSCSFGM